MTPCTVFDRGSEQYVKTSAIMDKERETISLRNGGNAPTKLLYKYTRYTLQLYKSNSRNL